MLIDLEDCNRWRRDRQSVATAKQRHYEIYCGIGLNECKEFAKNPTTNPLTGRKISPGKGAHEQISRLCQDMDAKRQRLIDLIKRHLHPLLNRQENLDNRVRFARVLTRYIKDVKPCLRVDGSRTYLIDKNDKPFLALNRRIGTGSMFGEIYLNSGLGMARLLKVSCKIIVAHKTRRNKEIDILRECTKWVMKRWSHHLPIMYSDLFCEEQCATDGCPSVLKRAKHGYYVVLNELANGDLRQHITKRNVHRDMALNIFAQILLSILTFHRMGYVHYDCHLANFIFHDLSPGGCWAYAINNKEVFIENRGMQVVIWDFGISQELNGNVEEAMKDYASVANSIIVLGDGNPLYDVARVLERALVKKQHSREEDLVMAMLKTIVKNSPIGKTLNASPFII